MSSKHNIPAIVASVASIASCLLRVTVERTEIKGADPRKLILESLDRFDKHLRMLGDLTGEFKQPQNPIDEHERINIAVEQWMAETKGTREEAKDRTGEIAFDVLRTDAERRLGQLMNVLDLSRTRFRLLVSCLSRMRNKKGKPDASRQGMSFYSTEFYSGAKGVPMKQALIIHWRR